MALPNNGLYILGPLSNIGRRLARTLSDRCTSQYNAWEMKAPHFTPAPNTYLNFDCERNRITSDLDAMKEDLIRLQPSLEHCTAAPRLKAPMVDLYQRLLHLIDHKTASKQKTSFDSLLYGDLPPLAADVRGVQLFVSALETAAEVHATLVRAKAIYLDVQHQQRYLLDSYKEMEDKFIIGTGVAAEIRKLSATISSDEERYVAFRVKHASIILEAVPHMRHFFAVRTSVEEVFANPQVNEFAVPFHLENWLALCALSVDLRQRFHDALMIARKDVNEYQINKSTPEVEEYRKERVQYRNSLLKGVDSTVYELLKTPA